MRGLEPPQHKCAYSRFSKPLPYRLGLHRHTTPRRGCDKDSVGIPKKAGAGGFEPPITESESAVLPASLHPYNICDRTRTCNPRIRSPLLLSIELRRYKCKQKDSNLRPPAYQTGTLPTELCLLINALTATRTLNTEFVAPRFLFNARHKAVLFISLQEQSAAHRIRTSGFLRNPIAPLRGLVLQVLPDQRFFPSGDYALRLVANRSLTTRTYGITGVMRIELTHAESKSFYARHKAVQPAALPLRYTLRP